MVKTIAALAIVLAGGIAVAYFLPDRAETDGRMAESVSSSSDFRDRALEQRLLDLERAVTEERQARQLLQEEVMYLTDELDALRGEDLETAQRAVTEAVAAASSENDGVPSRRERIANRNSAEFRIQRLVDAGISPARAEWVLQREAEVRMATMEARFAAQKNGERFDFATVQAEADAFRNELGAEDYERYLEGTGRSTSVLVGSVLPTSPAQNVGLLPGDSIVSYDGTRVYNMSDLNRAMLAGESGETVVAQVVRDGVTMQVAVRRGPLGITAGRSRRR